MNQHSSFVPKLPSKAAALLERLRILKGDEWTINGNTSRRAGGHRRVCPGIELLFSFPRELYAHVLRVVHRPKDERVYPFTDNGRRISFYDRFGRLDEELDGEAPFIRRLNFPVFTDFYMPASSISRWELKEFQGVTKIGEVSVYPGDYVLGDMDGVVVIPQRLTAEILVEAEKAVQHEKKMRPALRTGMPLHEVKKKFGPF